MKFGIRTPSLKKMFAARISPFRFIRHNLGLKAPRGLGFITSPKRYLYNKVYYRTTIPLKKALPLLLFIGILIYSFVEKKLVKPFFDQDYYTTTYLNLREGPSTNYPIIVVIKPNSKIEIIVEGNKWSKIEYGNQTGFVFNKFITH